MPKVKDPIRYNHGNHNEEACNYLDLKPGFTDWVITTAFYSALQFVSYQIFPFDLPSIEGKKTTINNIDEFYLYKKASNSKAKKHDLLADLVNQYCPVIFEEYEWLLSMSMTARYRDYQFTPEFSQKAKSLMQKIKKHCQPSKGL